MKQQKVEKKPIRNRLYYIKWIAKQYASHKSMIMLLIFLTALSTVVAVLFPIVFKHIIDSVVEGLEKYQTGKITMDEAVQDRNRMMLLLLAMGLGPVFAGIYPYFRAKMNVRFEMFFREKVFSEILSKNYKFFLRFRTGDLVTRLTEDIKTWPPGLAWLCCSGIFRALTSFSVILFCLIAMLLLNWQLALIACVPLPIMLMIFMKLESRFNDRFKEMQEGMSESNDFLEASYSGIKIINSFNSQLPQQRSFSEHMKKRIGQEIEVDTLWGYFLMFFEFLNYIGELLVLIFGGYLVITGNLSLGSYYAFFSYLGMIIYPLMDIPMLLVTLTQACVAIDRLEQITQAEESIDNSDTKNDTKTNLDGINEIELEKVSFSYTQEKGNSDNEFGFNSINLKVIKGEKIAITGQIGSGKTTLLNIISGVIEPDSGTVKINGLDIKSLNQKSVLEKIGYIQQEPVIFSETITTNIDFWRSYSQSVIESCSKLAQFHPEIAAFPAGYLENVGQRGVTLSGGQRQRLSIARALAGNPDVLLMDDITSSLDASNEQRLWQELELNYGKITCIIVTHRISTAMMADRIVVLNNGTIEAEGTHEQLIKTSKTYRKLTIHR